MVTKACLFIGSFLILQTCATIAKPKAPLYGTNEVYSPCNGQCQKTCTKKNPMCPRICRPGCICKPNYVKNNVTGECIKEDQCPGCNGDPNAVTGCDPCGTNCDNYDAEPKICTRLCIVNACKCIDGFVKNSEGICIPYEKCPPLCGTNEVYSGCGGHCQKTCANKNSICSDICLPGCICQPNYVRDSTGVCIKEDQCPPLCGTNEVYSGCGGHCQKTCTNKNPICSYICLPGCVCQPSYVRDDYNFDCIKEDQCSLVCGRNEVVSRCSGRCQRTCTISNPICPRICQRGCICQPDYVRDDNTGKCIRQNSCPKIRCGINEVKTNCLPGCGQDTCERAGKGPSVCNTLVAVPCRVGCVCRKDFFRNADNVCTSADNCLKCQKPNEVFGCRSTCDDKTCASLTKPCNIINKRCTGKCYCRKGYARDRGGQCIPIDQCPMGCNGDPNAEKGCDTCGTNCDNYNVEPKICSKRPCRIDECKCRDGFVKNSEGLCIPYKKCQCPTNEEYNCVKPCPPRTCSSRPINYMCMQNQKCVDKCDCKGGFLRNTKGICVPIDDCKKEKKCPINEEYNCVMTCPPRTCIARNAKYMCTRNQKCVNKCDCKNGFLRNTEGICVAIDDCGKEICQPECPINQEYKCVKPCPPKICLPKWSRIRYSCPPNQKCINKCDCKEGFLKNGQGTCVPQNQCYEQNIKPVAIQSKPNPDDASSSEPDKRQSSRPDNDTADDKSNDDEDNEPGNEAPSSNPDDRSQPDENNDPPPEDDDNNDDEGNGAPPAENHKEDEGDENRDKQDEADENEGNEDEGDNEK